MPRICALMSWYEERPDWLHDTVTSLKLIGADTIVAVDGAYALYPGGQPRSDPAQRDAILAAAADAGIACALHQPATTWAGGEVSKRAFLFAAGEAHTGPDDWYFVIDGDEVIVQAPDDLHDRLDATTRDAGYCALLNESAGNVMWAQYDEDMPTVLHGRKVWPIRCMFRAIRGLTVKGRHHDYITPDGRNLWGDNKKSLSTPTITFSDIAIDHRREDRDPDRRDTSLRYYDVRDAAGIEHRWQPVSSPS